jgi:glycosyltransferase involved in cell wall biosynthesis
MSNCDVSPTIAILLPDLGGAERVCLNLANEFAGRGLQVLMVLMRSEGDLLPLLDARVEVVDLGAARVRDALWPLVRHLRKDRPGALLANMWPLTFLAVLARKLARIDTRVVAVEHIAWSATSLVRRKRTAVALKASMKWMQPRVEALLAVSGGAAQDLERFAGLPTGAVRVQYNPVVPAAPKASHATVPEQDLAWLHGKHRRLIAVGSFKTQKNFPLLLQAFAQLSEKLNARLLILGEGDERPTLESLIRELGLGSTVELPGFVVDPSPYYDCADLFVLSSDYEGFGNVIVEALDHGVPVVSTDCLSGPSEILQHGKYGNLVAVGDVNALARGMLESLQSIHDHAALKSRARDFAVDIIADQYLEHLLPGWRQRETA